MSKNIFFENKGPFTLIQLFPGQKKNIKLGDVKTLIASNKFDITFFDSLNYKEFARSTNASVCITTEKLKKYLPKTCIPITVKNVFYYYL